jgi:vancomycin resistance protein VanJ
VPMGSCSAPRSRARKMGRLAIRAVPPTLLAMAAAPFLAMDAFLPGMLLTYPPRGVVAALASIAAVPCLLKKRWVGLGGCLVALCLALLASLGGGPSACPPGAWTLVALNTKDGFGDGAGLADLCRKVSADVLCFQEVRPESRPRLEAALPEYRFFAPDPARNLELDPRSKDVRCVTGIRKTLLEAGGEPLVEGAITGYRTFAVAIGSGEGRLWIVNVHSTKPINTGRPWWRFATSLWWKPGRHREERERLEAWLGNRAAGDRVILAGDFNAPERTWNVRIPEFTNAHESAGTGFGWTWPGRLPLFRIDHVLGRGVDFCSYETFDPGFSDHRGQVARFTLR